MPESVEEISIEHSEVEGTVDEGSRAGIRLDRLLVRCGLATSTTDAARKLKQGAVRVDNVVTKDPRISVPEPAPARLTLKVGKQVRVAVIRW